MVLIRCADKPDIAFALVEGKIHLPTLETVFDLRNIRLDGVIYPAGAEGLTFAVFDDNVPITVSGDPAGGCMDVVVLLASEAPCMTPMHPFL